MSSDTESLVIGEVTPTAKGVIYILLSITSIVWGLTLQSPFFFILGAGSLIITINSFSRLHGRGSIKRSAEPEEVFEGSKIKVRLKGKVKAPGAVISVYDENPPVTERQGRCEADYLNEMLADKINYSLVMKLRGLFRIGPLKVLFEDPGGIFRRDSEVKAVSEVTVLPKVEEIPLIPSLKATPRLLPGFSHSRSLGQGKEFHSLREWKPGDPFKQINWPATARARKIIVNQFEAESITDVVIVLDGREWTGMGDPYENPLEQSIRLSANIIRALIAGRDRVGLLVIGKGVRYVRPGGGRKHFRDLLHELAVVTPSGGISLLKAFQESSKYFTPGAPIILLSPFSEGLDALEGLQYLLTLKHNLIVLSPDPIEEELKVSGVRSPRYIYHSLQRDILISYLLKGGARVLNVPPGKNIKDVLKEAVR